MFNTPLKHARPKRVYDGEDVVESLDTTVENLLWGDVVLHDGTVTVQTDALNDVRIGDFIEVPYEQ